MVNHDGGIGTAPDPLVWSAGALPKRRRLVHAVRDGAFPLQLLNSSHVRERDKALLRSIIVGGVWNGLLLGRVRSQAVPCRFCGAPDNDGHLFLGLPFSSSC